MNYGKSTYSKGDKPYFDKFNANGEKIGAYRSESVGENWPFAPSKKCPLCGKLYEISLRINNFKECFHDE